jgi:hypothetical protein
MDANSTGGPLGATGAGTPRAVSQTENPAAKLPTAAFFPSVVHLRSLRQSLKAASFRWEGITSAQRWEYHAYDYAFLRVRLGLDERKYPLDPYGDWFNETMVRAAESLYRPRSPSGAVTRPLPRVKYQPFPAAEARMTPAQVNASMGVSATERMVPKHEDPEELRKAAIELGILQEAE